MEIVAPPQTHTILPGKLAEIVSAQQIQQNEAALLARAPEVDESSLEAARQELSSLYLIHATAATTGFRHGILPHVKNSQVGNFGMTFSFDKSLGLDQCAFFSWPLPHNSAEYKDENRILVSPDLLLDDRCFVTPEDILEVASVGKDKHGKELDEDYFSKEEWTQQEGAYELILDDVYQELQRDLDQPFEYDGVLVTKAAIEFAKKRIRSQIQNLYISKIVSGRVWFEYVAREFAAHPGAIPSLGEIKFAGTVPPSMIEAIIDSTEYFEHYEPHVNQVLSIETK